MLASTHVTDDFNLLHIPQILIELLIKSSLDRERLTGMTADDLALFLSIDIEAAKLILNAVTYSSNLMAHDMRELR